MVVGMRQLGHGRESVGKHFGWQERFAFSCRGVEEAVGNPEAYLSDILARIADHPIRDIGKLLPSRWKPFSTTHAAPPLNPRSTADAYQYRGSLHQRPLDRGDAENP
jgi:hypothetical protein